MLKNIEKNLMKIIDFLKIQMKLKLRDRHKV